MDGGMVNIGIHNAHSVFNLTREFLCSTHTYRTAPAGFSAIQKEHTLDSGIPRFSKELLHEGGNLVGHLRHKLPERNRFSIGFTNGLSPVVDGRWYAFQIFFSPARAPQ